MTCLDIMKCEGKYDMFGACKSGCKSGFVGEHCMHKGNRQFISHFRMLLVNNHGKIISISHRK